MAATAGLRLPNYRALECLWEWAAYGRFRTDRFRSESVKSGRLAAPTMAIADWKRRGGRWRAALSTYQPASYSVSTRACQTPVTPPHAPNAPRNRRRGYFRHTPLLATSNADARPRRAATSDCAPRRLAAWRKIGRAHV